MEIYVKQKLEKVPKTQGFAGLWRLTLPPENEFPTMKPVEK